jgi:hypothetical protein
MTDTDDNSHAGQLRIYFNLMGHSSPITRLEYYVERAGSGGWTAWLGKPDAPMEWDGMGSSLTSRHSAGGHDL